MRFFRNQECGCFKRLPTNVTLWPLSRSISNERSDPDHWGLLTPHDFIGTALNCGPDYQDIGDPIENEQADLSNTQCRFIKGQIPNVVDTIDNPYVFQTKDLSFIDFPTFQDKAPGARLVPNTPGSLAVLCLDDVFRGLKTIAMSIHNWEAMNNLVGNKRHGRGLEEFLKDESQCAAITNLSTFECGQQPVYRPEYPKVPQQFYMAPKDNKYHSLRLLTCIVTSVDTFYFVDLTGPATSFSELNKKIRNYVETAIHCYCIVCEEYHEGKPKVWVGVEYLRFAELWSCKATELGLEPILKSQREAQEYLELYWPVEDYHGEEWEREIPKVRSLVPFRLPSGQAVNDGPESVVASDWDGRV
ncbi:hypothetical protein CSAL01_02937 [Colletotrichum salicis]|uniref:Uncharacterized protein n=1 Tax=Colletotrichum salicis TaxID=1209931 RepID=A0A135UYP4_9PEZI|nr:hypothetical protein CSAL01_02937 [Colletotrichum salicis]